MRDSDPRHGAACPRGGVEPVAVVAPECGNLDPWSVETMRTEPTTATCTLMCRLRSHVVTSEGDFVPAGTPVKVMGWTGNDENGPGAGDEAKVEVRASAYMYADGFDYDTGRAAVGRGLFLSVEPSNLVYDEITEDFPRD